MMHRIRRSFLIAGSLVWIALGPPFSEAQYTANYQTNLISGVTSNLPGSYYYVGNTNFADVLLIENSGVLSNTYDYVGYSASSSNNGALVSGQGSVWACTDISIGFSGAGNSLVISNDGQLFNSNLGYVGYSSSSSNNSVLVSGPGSVWSNGAAFYDNSILVIGVSGSSNTVVINNGGNVCDDYSYIGNNTTATGNCVTVTDPGSMWSNGVALYIGYSGAGNSLGISNGGQVVVSAPEYDSGCFLGYNPGSSNNSVWVTGAGSVCNDTTNLYVGYSGAGNSLVIGRGGTVSNTYGYIGENATANGNSVVVSDAGSTWLNTLSLYLGYSGAGNSLVISNAGQLISGAFLYPNLDHTSTFLGYSAGSSNNSVLVTGSGSVWSNAYDLYIGYSGAGNSLVISNGGHMANTVASVAGGAPSPFLGYFASSGNNSVLVTGSGSVWSVGDLFVGYGGGSNSLVIGDGARVVARSRCWTGGSLTSTNNVVVVTDPGSVWQSLYGDMYVGYGRGGDNVVVKNGGLVTNSNAYVGCTLYMGHDASEGNRVLVTDPGSQWISASVLHVGDVTWANTLIISNGAQVADAAGYLGYSATSTNNTVQVVGGGVWQNISLYVGYQGMNNILEVGGGSVYATNLVVGFSTGGCSSNLLQLDSGSVIVTNNGTGVLEVRYGTLILDGGTLQVDTLVMTNACGLFVGNGGGTLIVSNLVLDPNLSAVDDGIPNGWKQQYGLDPLDSTLAGKDLDGTGFTVLQDYLAGLDPTNSASSFRIISIVPSGIDLLVTWMMGSGKTNALQATSGDATGAYNTNNFTDIFTVTNTVATTTNYLDTGAATNFPSRYYRVRVVP